MKIGISLYPNLLTREQLIEKLDIASKNKISLIFTSIQLDNLDFVGLNNDWSAFLFLFKECKKRNIDISVDISKNSIGKLGVTNLSDLSSIKELGIYSIRIDGGFNNADIAQMTNNKDGILIEINASMSNELEELLALIKKTGDLTKVLGCHNFFPKADTGLGWKRFEEYNAILRSYGVKIGVFFTTLGSKGLLCETTRGVPTIEYHRGIDVKYQINDFKAHGIEYGIISEPEFFEEELHTLNKQSNDEIIRIYIDKAINLDKEVIARLEKEIFTFRADQPEFLRRTEDRVGDIEVFNSTSIPKFSVTLDNVLNNRYSGELNFALKDFDKKDYMNVIGTITKEQQILIEYMLLPTMPFKVIFKDGK